MIPPRPEYVLILRRVPRGQPISIEELKRLVDSDVKAAHAANYTYLALHGFFGNQSVSTLIDDLVGKGYLRFGYDRNKTRGVRAAVMPKPDFVSMTDEARRWFRDQPGIKELSDSLPRSALGLLRSLADEVNE